MHEEHFFARITMIQRRKKNPLPLKGTLVSRVAPPSRSFIDAKLPRQTFFPSKGVNGKKKKKQSSKKVRNSTKLLSLCSHFFILSDDLSSSRNSTNCIVPLSFLPSFLLPFFSSKTRPPPPEVHPTGPRRMPLICIPNSVIARQREGGVASSPTFFPPRCPRRFNHALYFSVHSLYPQSSKLLLFYESS